ncbi:class F sortase [Micromonospora sp. DT81.3]|uniref:class F sortase n=1 Tax=Micromonospora sp. DT81.3 TaxID=3416523 RepID=UPI003CEE9846
MKTRLIAPMVLVLALAACAPAPSPSGAGAASSSPPPTASPAPAATPTVDVPIVATTPQAARAPVPPVRVRIAQIEVDMQVIPVGVEPGGFMELPVDPATAGWYEFGPDPWSADGNTVISAHIDAPQYPIGPFARLRDLTQGNEVVVAAADGTEARYSVASVTYYPKQELPVEEIFARSGTRALVLITCGGAFDSSTGRYADNVVVVAQPLA